MPHHGLTTLCLISALTVSGCAQWGSNQWGSTQWPALWGTNTAESPQAEAASKERGVIRGQSPAEAAWEPSQLIAAMPGQGEVYFAPGEEACSQPPLYGEFVAPPGYYVMPGGAPPLAAAPQLADPQAGWFDVLPAEGGPISPDFGLPENASVDNRLPNPVYVAANNPDAAWETIARTLSNYFPIATEERVQQTGSVLTEGRLETPWQSGATVLEPWRNDSVGPFNRWQSTLQTIRRRATVRVIPAAGGYEIGVRVDKQLEDLNRPELASAGAASLRNNSSIRTDRLTPVDRVRGADRWIDIGRDEPLEQEMLRRFRERLLAR